MNAQFSLGLNPALVPTTGYTVLSQSTGLPGENLISGLVPDLNAAAAAQGQLVAMLPSQYQANHEYLLQNPNGRDPLAQVLGQFQTANAAGFNQLQPYINALVAQQTALANELTGFFSAPYPP